MGGGYLFFYPLFSVSNLIPERRKELGLRPRFARNDRGFFTMIGFFFLKGFTVVFDKNNEKKYKKKNEKNIFLIFFVKNYCFFFWRAWKLAPVRVARPEKKFGRARARLVQKD